MRWKKDWLRAIACTRNWRSGRWQKAGSHFAGGIIIFDSTGMALQDAAAAVIVYKKAVKSSLDTSINFAE
jgi:ornithine cyclodeaminase/alanine dehydrogenase-like protein (mu-crystallin family)